MNVGMLWFDNDPGTELSTKINRAAGYYQQKYGLVPDVCQVHPCMVGEGMHLVEWKSGIVDVQPNRVIQPGHLWIGIEEEIVKP
jgi:hypothetical protein